MDVVPDTNVWIEWLATAPGGNAGRWPVAGEEGTDRILLSSVALQELWSARDPGQRHDLVALFEWARSGRRLLNPHPAAWVLSGQALGDLARKRHLGGARLRALKNDVLLAASALLAGATVLTTNTSDFALISGCMPVRYRAS